MKSRRLLAIEIFGLAAVYFITGKFGLSLPSINASATALWPPTGICLAALLLRGNGLWPGVFMGAFLVNFTTQHSWLLAIGLAIGNTLEAIIGAWLVRRLANGPQAFERTATIFKFVFLAAVISTAASATIGVTNLCAAGFAHWDQYPAVWLTWWLGDVVSDVVFAPLLILWLGKPIPKLNPREGVEAALLILAVIVTAEAVFLGTIPFVSRNAPLGYVSLLPLLWGAFRFGRRGAVTCAFITSTIALYGTLRGWGPFSQTGPDGSLLFLQAFTATITLTGLVLASATSERKRAEQRLEVQNAVSRVLASATSVTDATPRVLQALCEKAGWDMGAVWVVDPAAHVLVCEGTWPGADTNDGTFQAVTRQMRFQPGIGLPGRVWISGKPTWITDVTVDSNFPRAAAAAQAGFHGASALPIKLGSEVLGVIECFSKHARQPDEDFLQIADGIGAQFGQFAERKRTEMAKARLAAIVESSEDAIVSVDLDRIITSWNKGAERMYGYAAAEIVGKPISALLPEKYAHEDNSILERIRRGEWIENLQTVHLRKNGALIDVSLTVSPIRDTAGKISGASRIARDITEQKEMEQALARAQRDLLEHAEWLESRVRERTAQLQESVESLNSFCYSIAHDLRAPLRAMGGFSTALQEDFGDVLGETGRDYLTRIQSASLRMDRLISDLLEFGRLNNLELPAELVDLEQITESALAQMREEIDGKGAAVKVKEPLQPVRASNTMVGQVMTNLLSNALKFVKPDCRPEVEIWTEDHNGMVRVCVQDNGIGIREDHARKIFQPFVRLVNGSDYPGTGIGLAIVRKGVERMGGRVGLDSEIGRGSCFWIELPPASALAG